MEFTTRSALGAMLTFFTCLTIGYSARVSLSRVSTLYVPTYAADGSTSYQMGSMTVEQLAFDPSSKIIYTVGKGIIHIVDASQAGTSGPSGGLKLLDRVTLPELDMTDVEVCGQGVFVSYVNLTVSTVQGRGGVMVFQGYDRTSGSMTLLHDLKVGSLPDMVLPTADCTVLVAIENEGVVIDGHFYDPPGGVGIIRFPSGLTAPPSVKILDFTKFDNQFDVLSKSGVRWVYRENNTFSNNIEPEYITYNHDYTKAYICLQENNAIAVVDLATESITGIYGLGFKSWGQLDASDRDGGIHMQDWPIYGMYLPDTIHWVQWEGTEYIVTANEGDAQEYGGDASFSEIVRGSHIHADDIASTVSADLVQALGDKSKLGRLEISAVDGRNAEGKVERFYTYGGRSFSVWRASDMSLVFDSGSQLARAMRDQRPDLFNNGVDAASTVSAGVDMRSDNKGVEPEGLTVAEMGDQLVIFVGLERPGAIAVYTVAPSAENGGNFSPQLQQLFTDGIPQGRQADTYQQIYDDRELFAIDPEYMQYFAPSEGLADFPCLLVGGTVSGTISILRVNVDTGVDTAARCTVCDGPGCDASTTVMTCSSEQSLCVTNVTSTGGHLHVNRGCADQASCDAMFLSHSLPEACLTLQSSSTQPHLPQGVSSCHFCCSGPNCNDAAAIVPNPDTLYKNPTLIG